MAYYRAATGTAANAPERIGILLVNLGTPSLPSYLAVWRYLGEFLGDRRVIDTPRIIWWPVLYGFILSLRSFRTVRAYRKVWMSKGSPLLVYSRALSEKLAAETCRLYGDSVRVELAMTYGQPCVAAAIERLMQMNVKRLLVLPLYPQYCSSTTGAVFDRVCRALNRWRWIPETRFVNDYYSDQAYIDAIAAGVRAHWDGGIARSHLLVSFHGIPKVYVAQGDPYQGQAETTARLLTDALQIAPVDWTLTYQSRFGPVLWLQPYTEDTLKALAAKGVKEVTVVSPSFAVDCLETLEEIAVEYRETFAKLGGKLTLVPALNDGDGHVRALITVLQRHLKGWV